MGIFARIGTAIAKKFPQPRLREGKASGERIDHDEFLPLRPPPIWTWPNIQAVNAEHEIHNFVRSSTLCDSLMRDDEIQGLIQTRLLAVKGLPFRIEPEDQELLDQFPTLFPKNVQSEVLFWTLHMGFCVCELRGWNTGTPTLHAWHPSHVLYNDQLKRFQVMTKEEGLVTVEPGDGKWVVFTSWLERQPWMAALVRAVGLLLVIRQATLADWSRNSKVHGSPSKVLKAKASTAEIEDVQKAIAALRKMVSDSTIVLPDSCELFLLEPKIANWQVFKELRLAVEEALAILYLGQNLTTRVKSGSLAAAKVHQTVRQDFLEGDVQILMETTHRQVIFPYLQRVRGLKRIQDAPRAIWDATPPEDTERAAKTRLLNAQAFSYASVALQNFQKAGVQVEHVQYADIFRLPIVAGSKMLPPTADPPGDGEHPADGPRDDRPGKSGKQKKKPADAETVRAALARQTPTLMHWGRDPFIGGQLATDRLSGGAALDAVEIVGQVVTGAILDEIKACRDEKDPYGALKERLTKLLPTLDPQQLMWILNDAMSLAVGVGTYAAKKEGDGDGGA